MTTNIVNTSTAALSCLWLPPPFKYVTHFLAQAAIDQRLEHSFERNEGKLPISQTVSITGELYSIHSTYIHHEPDYRSIMQ